MAIIGHSARQLAQILKQAALSLCQTSAAITSIFQTPAAMTSAPPGGAGVISDDLRQLLASSMGVGFLSDLAIRWPGGKSVLRSQAGA